MIAFAAVMGVVLCIKAVGIFFCTAVDESLITFAFVHTLPVFADFVGTVARNIAVAAMIPADLQVCAIRSLCRSAVGKTLFAVVGVFVDLITAAAGFIGIRRAQTAVGSVRAVDRRTNMLEFLVIVIGSTVITAIIVLNTAVGAT